MRELHLRIKIHTRVHPRCLSQMLPSRWNDNFDYFVIIFGFFKDNSKILRLSLKWMEEDKVHP